MPGRGQLKTHCKRGHDLAKHSRVYVTRWGYVQRQCLKCEALGARLRYKSKPKKTVHHRTV